jgi:hypothetical protein
LFNFHKAFPAEHSDLSLHALVPLWGNAKKNIKTSDSTNHQSPSSDKPIYNLATEIYSKKVRFFPK